MHPRKCPYCGKVIADETGYHFDKNYNLICDECKQPVFLTTDPPKPPEIKKILQFPDDLTPFDPSEPIGCIPFRNRHVHNNRSLL